MGDWPSLTVGLLILNQIKITTRVFDNQRIRIGLIIFQTKVAVIEEAEIYSVTGCFRNC